jgi:type II restriction/modification system DNA methylase subunit YeeA
MGIQPIDFISKWKAIELTESAASHSHFIDLCNLLDEETPTDADPDGSWYCFERGASKTTGGKGWADVWKRECFGWEYKGKHKDLTAAFVQLQRYALALENPPLLVVCDLDRFRIHTNWTNSISEVHEFALNDLRDAKVRQTLKWVWSDPEKLKPGKTRAELTEEAAAEFAVLAQRLRSRGHNPEAVAHFVNRLVFCMFAESAGLLPERMFKRMLEQARRHPGEFPLLGSNLFRVMKDGGWIGFEQVDWFNGGLFDDDTAIPLNGDDIAVVRHVADLDWSEIDTSIFGTLFERGLDPDKRSQLGAHYTHRDKIRLIVEPVITRPWLAEWAQIKGALTALASHPVTPQRRGRQNQPNLAAAAYRSFIAQLRAYRVLDPACGSGNFLYVALLALKDIEHQITIEAEAFGFEPEFPHIGPESVLGIEINPYAAELARVTVWIGEIQWMRRNGFGVARDPILKPLDTIECRDAILNEDGTAASWPAADVIIGNPPFLGGKMLRDVLGDDYVGNLFAAYAGRVPAEADIVIYWFLKAWEGISLGDVQRAGLVATNSIRGGANRRVLDRIAQDGVIFDAWKDEPWLLDGAAVRVSLVCFARDHLSDGLRLDGTPATRINADLTRALSDLTTAHRLRENQSVAFMGDTKGGAFDIPGDLARRWLELPLNPNGRPNSDVLRPWMNGMDVTRRPSGRWIIDFGWEMSEQEAALYEAPYAYIVEHVRPVRLENRREAYATYWWRHVEPRPGMWRAMGSLTRYIATPRIARHRVFAWVDKSTIPDCQLIVTTRDDDVSFGILHSRFHEAWALRLCTWLGVGNDPRYTPSTTFETFPFPAELTQSHPAAFYASNSHAMDISAAARRLDELRCNWLNPTDLVRAVSEVAPGYPERLLPANDAAAAILKTRTLTNLYNERPAWLTNAHRDLDAAVAAAYGWPADISEDDALGRLLELNQVRAAAQKARPRRIPQPGPQQTLLLPIAGDKEPIADRASEAESPKKRERRRARTT